MMDLVDIDDGGHDILHGLELEEPGRTCHDADDFFRKGRAP
jgi:hypothetical protein